MADVKWIKIVTDIFDDEKILIIESMPEADSMIVIWFKLLCLAGKQNNKGVFIMNEKIVYTDEMFAAIFRRPINTVRMAIKTFESLGMVEIIDGTVTLPNWEKHQSLDAYERRKEYDRHRKKLEYQSKKMLISGQEQPKTRSQNTGESDAPPANDSGTLADIPASLHGISTESPRNLHGVSTESPRNIRSLEKEEEIEEDIDKEKEEKEEVIELCGGSLAITAEEALRAQERIDAIERAFKQNAFHVSEHNIMQAVEFVEQYGLESVIDAIKAAGEQGKTSLPYVNGILRNNAKKAQRNTPQYDDEAQDGNPFRRRV